MRQNRLLVDIEYYFAPLSDSIQISKPTRVMFFIKNIQNDSIRRHDIMPLAFEYQFYLFIKKVEIINLGITKMMIHLSPPRGRFAKFSEPIAFLR